MSGTAGVGVSGTLKPHPARLHNRTTRSHSKVHQGRSGTAPRRRPDWSEDPGVGGSRPLRPRAAGWRPPTRLRRQRPSVGRTVGTVSSITACRRWGASGRVTCAGTNQRREERPWAGLAAVNLSCLEGAGSALRGQFPSPPVAAPPRHSGGQMGRTGRGARQEQRLVGVWGRRGMISVLLPGGVP